MSNKIYSPIKQIPHYWKWQSRSQPVFSGSNAASDGSVITAQGTYSGSAPYGAIGGVKSGGNVANTTWEANATSGRWWQVKFPQAGTRGIPEDIISELPVMNWGE